MPYIDKDLRDILDEDWSPDTPGELNYCLTKIIQRYMMNQGVEKYKYYNDVIGALECCKLELYRRKTSIYEDKQKEINGDVW